jgi:hypothetical protein
MQYLRKFASHKEYMEAFASIESEEDRLRFKKAVCIFDDNCGSDTTKTVVKYSIRSSDAWVGDVIAWDTQENKWVIINRDDIGDLSSDNSSCTANFDTDRYIPDGVCVIPASHMENGKARYCALQDSCVNNEKAYSNALQTQANYGYQFGYIYAWSSTNEDVTTLDYYDALPLVKATVGKSYDAAVSGSWWCGTNSYLMILSEIGDITQLNIKDTASTKTQRKLYFDIDENDVIIDAATSSATAIGPYLYGDGDYADDDNVYHAITKYTAAFTPYCGETTKHLNLFNDLDGYKNTKAIVEYCEKNNVTCYAAQAAYDFHYRTDKSYGVQWYLPAAGEFVYLLNRIYTINLSLYKLYLIYNCSLASSFYICPININFNYWTST